MSEEKVKITIRISSEMVTKIKALQKESNCFSQNEFIENAIRFYIGYINCNSNTEYLNKTILNAVESVIDSSDKRISNNIFRLTVEMAMVMNLFAVGMEIGDDELAKLRARCIKEVKKINGKYSLENAVHFQQGSD